MFDLAHQTAIKAAQDVGTCFLFGGKLRSQLLYRGVAKNFRHLVKAELLQKPSCGKPLSLVSIEVSSWSDGINDAPALAIASVAIAMGGGTSAALDTAAVVPLRNGVMSIVNVIDVSKETRRKKLTKRRLGA